MGCHITKGVTKQCIARLRLTLEFGTTHQVGLCVVHLEQV